MKTGHDQSDQAQVDQTAHDEITHDQEQHPAKNGVVFNVALTALETGGSIALFQVAVGQGTSDVETSLTGAVAPVVGALVVWVRARRFSGASAAIFPFTIRASVDGHSFHPREKHGTTLEPAPETEPALFVTDDVALGHGGGRDRQQ